MAPPRDDPPRPGNAKDFLSGRGKYQEWNRLSPDGRVVCVIRSLDGERVRQKNQVRVWIGRIDGPSQATLLDEHYQIIGYGIGWSTHWISNERVEVEFYNYYDRSLSSVLDSEENVSSNHIATLAFHLDHNSGKFADKE